MGNFTFLESHWTDLAKLGDLSEKYVYSDPNTSIIKQGMLAEIMVKYMLAYDGIAEPEYDNTHANRIRLLKQNDLLPYEVKNTLYILRKDRNDAAHNGTEEGDRALSNLHLLYDLCVWYMQTYGDYNFNPEPYQDPVDYVVNVDELEKENKELEECNKALLIELQTIQKQGKADSNRRAVAYSKAMALKLTEAQTRELIDEQLRKCGWEADTTEIRYSKGTRPIKGKNLAIAEWPTDSKVGNHGYADYALFIGEKLVGIIEAKKKHTDISSVLDGQCKDYAKMIKSEHQKYVINRFGAYMAPFLYATNGRPYIKQYEQMSGIWFLDVRESFNAPKPLSGWPTPEGIEQALEKDIVAADKKLASTGYEVLQDQSKKDKLMSDAKFNSQIEGLINGLQADGKKDIICETPDLKVILPTDENYFLNNSMTEITDGNYKILGKIVQICKDSGEISLLRNTVFSKLQLDKMKEFKDLFNDPSLSQFVGEGGITTTIEAPVVMIIPIAIYI